MKKIFYIAVILLISAINLHAQLTTRVVKESLFIPWEIVYGPDNHIWLTQKNGYICRLDPVTSQLDTLYHETNTVVQGEGGMLGLALHPQFPTTPSVFVVYNYLDGSTYKERIVAYTYAANALSNPQTILDDIDAAGNHNGCRLLADNNYLYITTGDAAIASVAQDVANINGKILRINFDGSIPSDNPIAGSPVWSWGHRNAQGLVWVNGKLFETEHGPNNDDEVNIIQKGRNYGWPNVEGYCNTPSEITFCNDSNVVEPLTAWTPTLAVSGTDYYDHPMFPQFQKCLIMATLKDSKLYRLKLNTAQDDIDSIIVINGVSFGRLRDVCVAPNGKIYISTSNSAAGGTGAKTDKIIEIYDPSFTGIAAAISNDKNINIYPNPVANNLTIAITGNQYLPASYTAYNMLGQAVLQGQLTEQKSNISTAEIPAGIYQVQIEDNTHNTSTLKMLKQ